MSSEVAGRILCNPGCADFIIHYIDFDFNCIYGLVAQWFKRALLKVM